MKTLLCMLAAASFGYALPPTIAQADTVSTGHSLERALKQHLNADYSFEDAPVRALSVVCQTRGGRHYACMVVVGHRRQRARLFYSDVTVRPGGEWVANGGRVLPW